MSVGRWRPPRLGTWHGGENELWYCRNVSLQGPVYVRFARASIEEFPARKGTKGVRTTAMPRSGDHWFCVPVILKRQLLPYKRRSGCSSLLRSREVGLSRFLLLGDKRHVRDVWAACKIIDEKFWEGQNHRYEIRWVGKGGLDNMKMDTRDSRSYVTSMRRSTTVWRVLLAGSLMLRNRWIPSSIWSAFAFVICDMLMRDDGDGYRC